MTTSLPLSALPPDIPGNTGGGPGGSLPSSGLPPDIPEGAAGGAGGSRRERVTALAPGIAVAIAFALVARQLSELTPVSALTFAVIAGMILGNAPVDIERLRPGLAFRAAPFCDSA